MSNRIWTNSEEVRGVLKHYRIIGMGLTRYGPMLYVLPEEEEAEGKPPEREKPARSGLNNRLARQNRFRLGR